MTYSEFRKWCDDENVSLKDAFVRLGELVDSGDVSEEDASRWAMANLD